MARPNIDLRIIYMQGPTAKAEMREAARFINRTFPDTYVTTQQIGREFWVVAPDGTTEEMLGRIKRFIKDWARKHEIEFSVTDFLDDGSPFLDLPPDLAFPKLPPAEMHTGPYQVQVAVWLDGKGVDTSEPDQLWVYPLASTWVECGAAVQRVKAVVPRASGNDACRVRIVRRPN